MSLAPVVGRLGVWSLLSRLTLHSPTMVTGLRKPPLLAFLPGPLPYSPTCVFFTFSINRGPGIVVSSLLPGRPKLGQWSLGPRHPDHWNMGILEASEDLSFILFNP